MMNDPAHTFESKKFWHWLHAVVSGEWLTTMANSEGIFIFAMVVDGSFI